MRYLVKFGNSYKIVVQKTLQFEHSKQDIIKI